MCESGFYFNVHNCDQQAAVTLCCPCVALVMEGGVQPGDRLQDSPPQLGWVGAGDGCGTGERPVC